jgi:hypothetical protein
MESPSQQTSLINAQQAMWKLLSASTAPEATKSIAMALFLLAEARQASLSTETIRLYSTRLMAEVKENPANLQFIEKAIATLGKREPRQGETAFPMLGAVLHEYKLAKLGVPAGMTLDQFWQQQAEDAFAWVMRYIVNHGVFGKTKQGAFIFEKNEVGDERILGQQPHTPAPAIDEATTSALQALGGDVRRGLDRINTAGDGLGFIKWEFVQAYSRAGRAG